MGSMDKETKEAQSIEHEPGNDSYTPSDKAVDISPKADGGVLKEIKQNGVGDAVPPNGCKVIVHYEGKLTDGTIFDSSRERSSPFDFTLGKGSVIKAWDIGIATMKKGEVSLLICREDYAYGTAGSPPKIPAGATLIFEVELLDWEPENVSGKKDKGVLRFPITDGTGFVSPKETANVDIHLKGELDGRVFDERDVSFCLGEGSVVDIPHGLEKALEKFIKNETSRLELKPQYGFGAAGNEKFQIPPNASLTYIVTLKDFERIEDAWNLSGTKRLEEAKRLKERGTAYFKGENYQLALKMYNKMVEHLKYTHGFDDEEKAEADPLLLAANLNVSMCYLKQKNYSQAKNTCDTILETDKKNVKALFRRGQAYLGLIEPLLAKADFEAVLVEEPENKAVPPQVAICNAKLKEIRSKEKKMYANMFEKFAQKDREWRFGWLDGEKPQVELAPEIPGLEEERKKRKEAKLRYIENTRRLLEEKRQREEQERLEAEQKGMEEQPERGEATNKEQIENIEKAETPESIVIETVSKDETCKYKPPI